MSEIHRQATILEELDIFKSINIDLSPEKTEKTGKNQKNDKNDLNVNNKKDSVKIDVNLEEKSRFFANFSHFFEPKTSETTLSVKMGLRNVLGIAEKWTAEYDKALYNSKRSSFSFNFDAPWIGTGRSGGFGYQFGQRQVNIGLMEHFENYFLNYSMKNRFEMPMTLSLTRSIRNNEPLAPLPSSALNFIPPQLKLSLSMQYTLKNTLVNIPSNETQIPVGTRQEINWENTLPGSECKFSKIEYQEKRNFLPNWLKMRRNQKNAIGFELASSFGVLIGKSKNIPINDKLSLLNIRGFRELNSFEGREGVGPSLSEGGVNLGATLSAKSSLIFNFYDFPQLSKSGIIPFAHFTGALVSDKLRLKDTKNIRIACGMGVKGKVGAADLEVMYNWWHLRRKGDKEVNFQIRLSIFD